MDSYTTIIEIGSFSIKTIIYSQLNNEFSIIGTGKTRSRGYTGEDIENFDDFIDCIKNSIRVWKMKKWSIFTKHLKNQW